MIRQVDLKLCSYDTGDWPGHTLSFEMISGVSDRVSLLPRAKERSADYENRRFFFLTSFILFSGPFLNAF